MPTLRVEIAAGTPVDTIVAGSTINVTGSASTPWAPTYADAGDNPARTATVEAFGGPVYVAVGKTPDPTVEPRRLVRPGLKIEVKVASTHKFSAITAADVTL